MWQPGWEGCLGENGYMNMYGSVTLQSTQNYHSMVNHLFIVVQSLSCVQLFATPWTAACPAYLSFTVSGVSSIHAHWVSDATNHLYVCMLKSLLLCPTLCNPVDISPPGSSVHGISQVAILEWVAISFSRRSSTSRDRTCVSCTGRQTLDH